MMHILRYSFFVSVLMLEMTALGAAAPQQSSTPAAQQQSPQSQPAQNQPEQPIPASRESTLGRAVGVVAGNGPVEDTAPQQLAPDYRPIIGAQNLTLGIPTTARSFWQPYLDIVSTFDSNALVASNSGWTTWTSFAGGVDLTRTSGNSDLKLSYAGALSVSNDGSAGTGYAQQFGLAESLKYRRSTISFLDEFGCLPAAAAGYGGFGSTLSSGGLAAIQGTFTPDQSILTARGQRISNSFVTEVDTALTRRSSVTLVGSYGLLHYLTQGLTDNHEVIFQAGYNHVISRKDTIALLYRYDGFHFTGISQSINSHSVEISYARRVTGRMAFQLSAGPDVSFSRIPISGSTVVSTGIGATVGSGSTTQLFWNLNASLNYQLRRGQLGILFNHGVTGGSGVLAGALTDDASALASRQFSRKLTGSLMIGYSRNSGAAVATVVTAPLTNQTYNYIYSGLNFSRSLGRSMSVSLGYQLQYQAANSAFCITTPCGTSFVHHEIFADLGWHRRPINF